MDLTHKLFEEIQRSDILIRNFEVSNRLSRPIYKFLSDEATYFYVPVHAHVYVHVYFHVRRGVSIHVQVLICT